MNAKTAILLPNYKTPILTKLCLRSLRKFTDPDKIRVLVIDNGSNDASLEYLESLSWIELYKRTPAPDEAPAFMHTKAMDFLMEKVNEPYMISIHTDTIVLRPDWLDFMLGELTSSEKTAGVGSWKLERKNAIEIFLHDLEVSFKKILGRSKGEKEHFLRSHCALYRTDLFRKYTKGFGNGMTAGESAHRMLCEAGYEMKFVPSEVLCRYMLHLNHATLIQNPDLGGRRTSTASAGKYLDKSLNRPEFQEILNDNSLDK